MGTGPKTCEETGRCRPHSGDLEDFRRHGQLVASTLLRCWLMVFQQTGEGRLSSRNELRSSILERGACRRRRPTGFGPRIGFENYWASSLRPPQQQEQDKYLAPTECFLLSIVSRIV